jgi:hypothetical protein
VKNHPVSPNVPLQAIQFASVQQCRYSENANDILVVKKLTALVLPASLSLSVSVAGKIKNMWEQRPLGSTAFDFRVVICLDARFKHGDALGPEQRDADFYGGLGR